MGVAALEIAAVAATVEAAHCPHDPKESRKMDERGSASSQAASTSAAASAAPNPAAIETPVMLAFVDEVLQMRLLLLWLRRVLVKHVAALSTPRRGVMCPILSAPIELMKMNKPSLSSYYVSKFILNKTGYTATQVVYG